MEGSPSLQLQRFTELQWGPMRVITGQAKGAKLKAPRSAGLRPTSSRVKGALFSILGYDLIEGAVVLDLYAGTGALGIEALSRNAERVDFVERNARRCQAIRQNLAAAGLSERGRVYSAPAFRTLGDLTGAYDLVFVDPPYGDPGVDQVLAALGRDGLLRGGATIVLEHAWRDAAPAGRDGLQHTDTRRYGDTALSFYKRGPIS